MRRNSFASMVALSLAMGASAASALAPSQSAGSVGNGRTRRDQREYRSSVSQGSWFRHTYLKHGPSAAQVQRAAKKARNVSRHKRSVRR